MENQVNKIDEIHSKNMWINPQNLRKCLYIWFVFLWKFLEQLKENKTAHHLKDETDLWKTKYIIKKMYKCK